MQIQQKTMAEYEVTGVRWRMGDGLTIEQQTQKAIDFIKTLEIGTPMILAAEPDNPYDSEAIAVYMDYTQHVGYIKHECCKEIKPLLDSDGLCDAVVSGNDGHVTFFIDIPNASEVDVSPVEVTRKLPEFPLPLGIALAFSNEERVLQVVAPRLVKMVVTTDTASELLHVTERYMPLSRLSLCCEDDLWRDRVLKQLRKACKLKLPLPQKERLEQLRQELNETVGDFHRSHDLWQQRLFDQQLELLRKQAEGNDGLFAKFEKHKENEPNIIENLVGWFNKMPHVDLRNYKEHGVLAKRLSYIGVSRQELYEVYTAILLLDKYGAEQEVRNGILLPKELDTPRAREAFAKAIEKKYMEATDGGKYRWKGTSGKANTSELAYFLGLVYNYKYTLYGNAGEKFPEDSLNELFDVTRLYSSLTQVYNAKKKQRWRSLIDHLFE